MNDIMSVQLTGRLTRDAELHRTTGGTAVCNFSVASNRWFKSKDAEEFTKDTLFMEVALWGKAAEDKTAQLVKGAPVNIIGTLRQEHWEQDGVKRSRVCCVATSVSVGKKYEASSDSSAASSEDDDVPFDV